MKSFTPLFSLFLVTVFTSKTISALPMPRIDPLQASATPIHDALQQKTADTRRSDVPRSIMVMGHMRRTSTNSGNPLSNALSELLSGELLDSLYTRVTKGLKDSAENDGPSDSPSLTSKALEAGSPANLASGSIESTIDSIGSNDGPTGTI